MGRIVNILKSFSPTPPDGITIKTRSGRVTGHVIIGLIKGRLIKMDTGEGRFEIRDLEKDLDDLKKEFPRHGGIFTVGDEVELRGSLFRIKSIKPTELRLKLLKR